MLMWEIPPLVAGGTWTACYHLVRSVRAAGADVTVVVPWDDETVGESPFGGEVEIVKLGMSPPADGASPYGGAWSSYAYGSPYGFPGVYGMSTPFGSPYGFVGAYGFGARAHTGSRPRAARNADDPPDRRVRRAARSGRQPGTRRSSFTRTIGSRSRPPPGSPRGSASRGSRICTRRPPTASSTCGTRSPSGSNQMAARRPRGRRSQPRHVCSVDAYAIDPDKQHVVPNPISDERIPYEQTGAYEGRRAIYLGRLTRQKAPDLFMDVALMLRSQARRSHSQSMATASCANRCNARRFVAGRVRRATGLGGAWRAFAVRRRSSSRPATSRSGWLSPKRCCIACQCSIHAARG